jgi:hypothetical protein
MLDEFGGKMTSNIINPLDEKINLILLDKLILILRHKIAKPNIIKFT